MKTQLVWMGVTIVGGKKKLPGFTLVPHGPDLKIFTIPNITISWMVTIIPKWIQMVGLVGLLWDLPLYFQGLPDTFWNKKCAEYFGGCIPKNKCLVWCNWKPRLPKACGNF